MKIVVDGVERQVVWSELVTEEMRRDLEAMCSVMVERLQSLPEGRRP